jgi:hypothetical protein
MRRPSFRWLVGTAALVIAPKCVLCVLACIGFATLGNVEICAASDSGGDAYAIIPWIGVLAGGAVLLVLLALGILAAKNSKSAEKNRCARSDL